jgi:3-oxoacyl-[acyl-carrier-protein] synthase II
LKYLDHGIRSSINLLEEFMRKEVVITGLGCITPIGRDIQTFWENTLAGVSGVGPISLFDASEFKTRFAAEVKEFNPLKDIGRESRRMDRFSQFALFAGRQAVQNAQLVINDDNRDRIGAVIGSGVGGVISMVEQYTVLAERGPNRVSPFLIPMILVDSAGANLAIDLGFRGPNLAVMSACATGTNTIGEAAEMIRRGHADAVLAGGTEAGIAPHSVAGLINTGAVSSRNDQPQKASRPFDLQRDGFVIGEGAAVLVLESLEFALNRDANILAIVSGYGITNDAYHISAPSQDGEGAIRCMKMALNNAALKPEEIGYINAHGTSTVLNDKTETMAIKETFGEQAYSIPVSSTKSMIGHLLGASGSVEAILCVKALQERILPPTINYETPDPECDLDYVPNQARKIDHLEHVMSNSFGFGGHNATIILSRFNDKSNQSFQAGRI